MKIFAQYSWKLFSAAPASPESPESFRDRGFTLMEIIVAIVALALILYMMTGVFSRSGAVYEFMVQRQAITKQSRQAQDTFFNEAKYLDTLLVADAATVSFVRSDTLTTVTYELDGEYLKRTRNAGGTQICISHIDASNSAFSYYDEDRQPLTSLPLSPTDRALVRFIGIELTLLNKDQSVSSRRQIYLENKRWR